MLIESFLKQLLLVSHFLDMNDSLLREVEKKTEYEAVTCSVQKWTFYEFYHVTTTTDFGYSSQTVLRLNGSILLHVIAEVL